MEHHFHPDCLMTSIYINDLHHVKKDFFWNEGCFGSFWDHQGLEVWLETIPARQGIVSVGVDKRTRGHPPSVWKIMEVCIHIIILYQYLYIYHSFFFLKSLVIPLRVSLWSFFSLSIVYTQRRFTNFLLNLPLARSAWWVEANFLTTNSYIGCFRAILPCQNNGPLKEHP